MNKYGSYEPAEVEIIYFATDDVLTTSDSDTDTPWLTG